MSKRTGRLKGRKRRVRIQRVLLIGALLLGILGLIVSFPLLGHIKELRAALDRYDVTALEKELAWIDEEAAWLKKIPMIRDGEFWLQLNQGDYANLASQLALYPDDKHRFWLFQLHLRTEQESKAQQVSDGLQSSSLRSLAEGLLLARQGEDQKASDRVQAATDSDLSREEQVLKNIILARLEMSLGNQDKALEAWNRAKALSPHHPLIIETEYDLALASGQWGKAKELGRQIEEMPGFSSQPDYLIKKALLALTVGERQIWQQTIEELSTMTNGKAYQDYLLGNELYDSGQFKEAAKHFQSALGGDLTNPIKADTEKAWAQANERVQAEAALNQARKQP